MVMKVYIRKMPKKSIHFKRMEKYFIAYGGCEQVKWSFFFDEKFRFNFFNQKPKDLMIFNESIWRKTLQIHLNIFF